MRALIHKHLARMYCVYRSLPEYDDQRVPDRDLKEGEKKKPENFLVFVTADQE